MLSKNEEVELLANVYSAEKRKERVKSLMSDERDGQQRSIQLTQSSSLVGSRFRTDALAGAARFIRRHFLTTRHRKLRAKPPQTDHEAWEGGRGQESRAVTKEPTCTVRMVAL